MWAYPAVKNDDPQQGSCHRKISTHVSWGGLKGVYSAPVLSLCKGERRLRQVLVRVYHPRSIVYGLPLRTSLCWSLSVFLVWVSACLPPLGVRRDISRFAGLLAQIRAGPPGPASA